jgi:hypothetical protein
LGARESVMGDVNQLNFVRTNIDRFKGPYLEIGTRYGLTQEMRALFPDSDYVGVDMEEGAGVDIVLDLTENFTVIDSVLEGKRFNTIFCLSVLEHCKNPFLMCENITKLLNRNGVVYVSVPFSWQFHAFPSDYWRFTPEGLRTLFPQLVFDSELDNMSTSEIGDIRKIDINLCRINFSVSESLAQKRYGMAATIAMLKLFRRLGIASWLLKYRYLYPPVLINMVGRKA